MENDDIGEVGEWVGKSANVNAKKEDDEDEDDEEEDNRNMMMILKGFLKRLRIANLSPKSQKLQQMKRMRSKKKSPRLLTMKILPNKAILLCRRPQEDQLPLKEGKIEDLL